MDPASKTKVVRRINEWKLKLIDLSRRNRLINFTPTKSSSLHIISPEIDVIFERLVVKSRPMEVWIPKDTFNRTRLSQLGRKTQLVTSEEDPKQLERTLRNLTRRSASEYRERGVRILYISFGLLTWNDVTTNTVIKSPLLLTPIEVTRKTTLDPYKIEVPSVEEEVVINPALILKLQNDHKIELPPLPDFESQKASDYLLAVEEALQGMGWKLEASVNVGLFSFQKLVMYQDLNDNVERISEHPIVQALAGVSNRNQLLENLPKEEELDLVNPKTTFQVLDADSSQQLCIQYALTGQSFVMHGPPGTGKSQTIANMISEFIANGKSVLFVSEKMAALEVVFNRLKAKNLDDYCLELHSQKANKREVVEELNRCLTEHLRQRASITEEELDRLVNRRMQLNAYVDALHKVHNPLGLSAYQVLCLSAELEKTPLIPSGYPRFGELDQRKMLELEDLVRRLSNSWAVVEEGYNFPWRGCVEDQFTPETRSNWIHLLESTVKSLTEMISDSEKFSTALGLHPPRTIRDYERLRTLSDLVSSTPKPPIHWLEDSDLGVIKSQAEAYSKSWESYRSTVRELKKRYDTRLLVLSPGTAERVETSWIEIRGLLAQSKGDGGLLAKREKFKEFLVSLPTFLEELRVNADKISRILGIKEEVHTLNEVMKASELSLLCQEPSRPPRLWLEKRVLDKVKTTLRDLKKDYDSREALKERLSGYTDEILSLDLDYLLNYFENSQSVLRYLRPSYYRNKSLLTRVRKDARSSFNILEDLRSAKELKSLLEKIEASHENDVKALGPYYRDDSNLEEAEKAVKTAERVIIIFREKRVPKTLRDNLCYGTTPSEELIQTGFKVKDSISQWTKETDMLKQLIPLRRMPNTGKQLKRSDLKDVTEWSYEVSERLNRLEQVSAEALATRLSDIPSTYEDLIMDLKTVEKLQLFEVEVGEDEEKYREVFGGLYDGLHTDWDKVIRAVAWTTQLIRSQTHGLSDELKNAVVEEGGPVPPDPLITERWGRISKNLMDLKDRFSPPLITNPNDLLDLNELKDRLTILRDRIDELQVWVDFKSTGKRLQGEGLGEFIDRLIAQRTDRGALVDVFKKSMYQGLLDLIFFEDKILKDFRGHDHEQLIKDFKDLDQRFIQLTSYRVIENANSNKPQGVFVQAPDSEITILMREAAKKRRHMPLRELFDKVPNLIRRLKPCLMMSPISVSQFLIPGGLEFDLIVFDEASQIYTEDAVGSIYRGNEIVIAGDPKQLPPTPFFQTTMSDDFDWDEDSYGFDLFDSVLDECMSIGLPVKMLRWHYRSKHDSLISFSNDRYYDGRLVLFPASRMGADDLGVEFVHVSDGVYSRGGTRDNIKEAEVVTNLVFDHFEKHPEKTLGVVTFSIAQMNRVQDSIDNHLRSKPGFEKFFVEDRLNGFFVKNLENVQGDERDVIIFSVGYGYDDEGKMTMNFGPLNKPGGERRLNVAITRAKEKVILVSSIRYDDISLDSSKAEGVNSLRSYLRYAEKRPRKLDETKVETPYGFNIELEVAKEVENLGYKAVPWVGSSTFRVDVGVIDTEDPGRFMLGIMCDGDDYRTASTARDRDRLRIQILEGLGWRIHRVWSPDWVQRRSTEVKRLESALRMAEKKPIIKNHEKKVVVFESNKVAKLQVTQKPVEQLPELKPYVAYKIKTRNNLSKYPSEQKERMLSRYRKEVRNILPKFVSEEGPVHIDLAFSRINSALNVRRATAELREVYMDELKKANGKRFTEKNEFLWPSKLKTVQVRTPVNGNKDTFRSIQHIPPEEIVQAMLLVAKHSFGLSAETLMNETASILGFKRTGANIKTALTQAYGRAKSQGLLSLDDGVVLYTDSKGS